MGEAASERPLGESVSEKLTSEPVEEKLSGEPISNKGPQESVSEKPVGETISEKLLAPAVSKLEPTCTDAALEGENLSWTQVVMGLDDLRIPSQCEHISFTQFFAETPDAKMNHSIRGGVHYNISAGKSLLPLLQAVGLSCTNGIAGIPAEDDA
jgi:hypothetical protein